MIACFKIKVGVVVVECRMRMSSWTPSIVPDRTDQTVYLVENDFGPLGVARQSGWEHSDNQDGHFGGRGGMMIVAARR